MAFAVILLLLWFIGSCGFAYWLVETYAKPDTSISVKGTVFVCWVIAFVVPFLLPLDFYGSNRDLSEGFWMFIYVISGLLCWVFVPLLQNYFNNGGFTFWDRVKLSLLMEAKFYAVVGAVAGILIGIMLLQDNFTLSDLPNLILVLANTWGLGLLTILLGYGVVAIPKLFWYWSDRKAGNERGYQLLYSISEESITEQDRLQQLNYFVDKLELKYGTEHELLSKVRAMLYPSHVYEFAGVIPGTPMEDYKSLRKLEQTFEKNGALQYDDFMKLHYMAISHRRAYRLAYAEWTDTINEISFNEKLRDIRETYPHPKQLSNDICLPPTPYTYAPFPGAWIWCLLYGTSSSSSTSSSPTNVEVDLHSLPTLEPSSSSHSHQHLNFAQLSQDTLDPSTTTTSTSTVASPTLHSPVLTNSSGAMGDDTNITRRVYLYPLVPGTWYTRLNCIWFRFLVYRLPLVAKISSVICTLFSLFTLYSELTIMVPSNISVMSLVQRNNFSLITILLVTLPLLLYINVCTFYTLFRFRLFSFYHMHKRQRTGEASILHNAAFMLRLIMPLSYNYFRILQDKTTAFSKVHGNMTSVPFFGGAYNTYMPLFIIIVAIMTLAGSKLHIFRRLGFTQNNDEIGRVEGRKLYERELHYKSSGQYVYVNSLKKRVHTGKLDRTKLQEMRRQRGMLVHSDDEDTMSTTNTNMLETNDYNADRYRNELLGNNTHDSVELGDIRSNTNTNTNTKVPTSAPSSSRKKANPYRTSNGSHWDAKNTIRLEDF